MSTSQWPELMGRAPKDNEELITSWRSFIFNGTSLKSPKRLKVSYTNRGDLYSYARHIAAVWKDAAGSPNVFAVTGGSSVTTNKHTREVVSAFKGYDRFFELEDSIGLATKKDIAQYLPFITEGVGVPGTGDASYESLIYQRSYTDLLGKINEPTTRIAWIVITIAHALSYLGTTKRARSERVIEFSLSKSKDLLANAAKLLELYEVSDEKSNKLNDVVAPVKEAVDLITALSTLRK